MNERREPRTEEGGQPETSPRKAWHAPQFLVSGLASTDAQGNGGLDGATQALSQS
jgi:hypothetical protein